MLQKISLTGGLAQFTGSILGSATIAEAKVNTLSGPVSGLVEFLPGQWVLALIRFALLRLATRTMNA